MPISCIYHLRNVEYIEDVKVTDVIATVVLHASTNIVEDESLRDKEARQFLLLKKETPLVHGVSDCVCACVRIRLVRRAPVWRHRKSINDEFSPVYSVVRRSSRSESRSCEIVDTYFSDADRRQLPRSDTAKYCFDEYSSLSGLLQCTTLIASRSIGAEYDCFIIRSSSRTWKSFVSFPLSTSFFYTSLLDLASFVILSPLFISLVYLTSYSPPSLFATLILFRISSSYSSV